MGTLRNTSLADDVISLNAPSASDLTVVFEQFSMLMSKGRHDDAFEFVESYRKSCNTVIMSSEDSLCHLLIATCAQLTKLESTYLSLNFMLPKAFFRKESTLTSTHSQIKSDLCRLALEETANQTIEDFRRRLIDFISARMPLIELYSSLTPDNLTVPNELVVRASLLTALEELIEPLTKHKHLSAFFLMLLREITTLKLLLETQLALIRCEFLSSLMSLKNAGINLKLWCSMLGFRKGNTKKSTNFFGFGSQSQCSHLKLCEWMDDFYVFLLAKFSFYFYDVLQPQCTTSDFDQCISAIKSPNFIQSFTTFYRKTDPTHILLIVNRTNAPDIPAVIGFSKLSPKEGTVGELQKNFLILVMIGGEKKQVYSLLPSLSALVEDRCEKDAKKNGAADRVTYYYDSLIGKSFFVMAGEYATFLVVVYTRKVAERDGPTINFMQNNISLLRFTKLCQSLRGSC